MPHVFIKGTVDAELNNIYLGKVVLLFFFYTARLVAESIFLASLGICNWTQCSTALHCFVGWISFFFFQGSLKSKEWGDSKKLPLLLS